MFSGSEQWDDKNHAKNEKKKKKKKEDKLFQLWKAKQRKRFVYVWYICIYTQHIYTKACHVYVYEMYAHKHTHTRQPPEVPSSTNYFVIYTHHVTKASNRYKEVFSTLFSSRRAQAQQLFLRKPSRTTLELSKTKHECTPNTTKQLLGLSQVKNEPIDIVYRPTVTSLLYSQHIINIALGN